MQYSDSEDGVTGPMMGLSVAGSGGRKPSAAMLDVEHVLKPEDIREALMGLASRDAMMLLASLGVLERASMNSSPMQKTVFSEGGVQRLGFFICSLNAGSATLRSNTFVVDKACEALASLLAADPSWAGPLAKECGSRNFAALLKIHIATVPIAQNIVSILLAISKHEKNCSLVARLDGGIFLLLQMFHLPSLSRSSLVQCIKLLQIYANGSDNNVSVMAKKNGFTTIAGLMKVHTGDNEITAPLLSLLSSCANNARNSAVLGESGVCEATIKLLSLRTTDACQAEVALKFILRLSECPENVSRLWNSGAFHVIWLVVTRFGTEEASLVKAAGAAIWKMLLCRGIVYPVDLDGVQQWRLPVYPPNRGMVPAATAAAAAAGGGDETPRVAGSDTPASRAMAAALSQQMKSKLRHPDWFPEHAASSPAVRCPEHEPPKTSSDESGVFTTPHGVRSLINFKVQWPSCPSLLQASSANAFAPMRVLSSEQRAGLVQYLMLSVVARLVLPRKSFGDVVYDRYASMPGAVVSDKTRAALAKSKDPRLQLGGLTGSVSDSIWGGVSTGDAEMDALLFYAADEAEEAKASTLLGRGSGAGRMVGSSSRRSIKVTLPQPPPMHGGRAPAVGSGLAYNDDEVAGMEGAADSVFRHMVATPGLSMDPTDLSIDSIIATTSAEGKEWDSVKPLKFESKFECGNLRAAVRVAPREYDLILAPDINNGGHTQWFYFHVRGFETSGQRYRFNIINLEKADSTYNYGMRPLMYCTHKDAAKVSGWTRVGEDICYFQNHFSKHKHGTGLQHVPQAGPGLPPRSSPLPQTSSMGSLPEARAGEARVAPVVSSSSIASMGSIVDDTGLAPPIMNLYTASFSVEFPADARGAFLAYCYPYSFTDMMLDMREWDQRADRVGNHEFVAVTKLVSTAPVDVSMLRTPLHSPTSIMRRTVLCNSLAGNPVPLLTITNFSSPQAEIDERPYVVLSARVHPGETNASWMMRGVLDFLTSSAGEAESLRQLCVFKIIPFLNPDGVINGHHRTNLTGEDLNRHWSNPVKGGTPTVTYAKQLLAICKKRRVSVFCDFHGHSRKKNIFMFGCENDEGCPERIFPRLLEHLAPDFSYKTCNFAVQKSKANCARVAVWRDLGITNSYTLEASFCGADQGPNKDVHFTPRNYEEMGHHFCEGLQQMLLPNTSRLAEVMLELQSMHASKFVPGGDGKSRKKGAKKRRARAVAGVRRISSDRSTKSTSSTTKKAAGGRVTRKVPRKSNPTPAATTKTGSGGGKKKKRSTRK